MEWDSTDVAVERVQFVEAMDAPLLAFLDRIASCEVLRRPASTALLRARFSDDPALRPALRRVVEAWRSQTRNPDTAGHALVALAVLGERPDYFIEQVEAALADGSPDFARDAVRISSFFADSARYARLQELQARYPDDELELQTYWYLVEDGFRADDVFDFPLDVAVDGMIGILRDLGFWMQDLGDGVVRVNAAGGRAFTPDNVLTTVAFRRLGASNPAAMRAAVEASAAYPAPDAEYGDSAFVATYRRAILSAALPGESLTSDTFDPPADRSLLTPAGP